MRFILLGPPGAGKGTLANLLKNDLNLVHISTGDLLRQEIKNNTPLGTRVQTFIESGKLVPDELVTEMMEQRLARESNLDQGFMLDGFPRTQKQAEDLDRILARFQKPLDYALYLESTLPVIIRRLTGRRICRQCGALYHMTNKLPKRDGICDECGGELYQRSDDKEETIQTRLDVYMHNTQPIIDYYAAQGKLHKLNADKDADALKEDLMHIFDEDGKVNSN